MNREPSFIEKLISHALMETFIAVCAGFVAVWGSISYFEFMQSTEADRPFIPIIFMFGVWPFVVALVLALLFAGLAAAKTQRV